MELRQLRYFLKAKELMNFTEAANALHISQSTLSQQIKQLETEIDTPLFNRIGKRIQLTEAGNIFADFAKKSVRSSEESLLAMHDLKKLSRGNLKIGVSYGLRSILVPAVKNFIQKYPQINLEILFETTDILLKKLGDAELDLVLSYQEAQPAENFIYQNLFVSEMMFVTSVHSEFSKLKKIDLKTIAALPLAMPFDGFSTTHYVMDLFKQNLISPNVKMKINDIPTLIEIVENGILHTILADSTVTDQQNLVTIPIKENKAERKAVLMQLKEAYQTEAMKSFAEMIVKI